MSMCGIPWWNTDIGGFFGGDTQSEEFRELIVRWFQYGVFSPVMRLHGNRNRPRLACADGGAKALCRFFLHHHNNFINNCR